MLPPEWTVIARQFLLRNYDYVWLKTMLDKGRRNSFKGATLLTGPSYGIFGVEECCWKKAINCSVDSQDLYYDFLCAKDVLSAGGGQLFSKCFIIVGYFSAWSDLSLSTNERERMIAPVFYPIFDDAHHWENAYKHDLWMGFGDVPAEIKLLCEKSAASEILKRNTYFSDLRRRSPFFNLQGRTWYEVTMDEKMAMGAYRVQAHSKAHKTTLAENKDILKEYVHFLHMNDVLPIVILPPFSNAYKHYIGPETKETILELVDSVPEDVHYVDFNQCDLFDDTCFMDTDHLNEKGAHVMCKILVEMFGP